MQSVRDHPEAYAAAVSAFVSSWSSMIDRERIMWLKTKIIDASTTEALVSHSPVMVTVTVLY